MVVLSLHCHTSWRKVAVRKDCHELHLNGAKKETIRKGLGCFEVLARGQGIISDIRLRTENNDVSLLMENPIIERNSSNQC